ncbi:hypothetical protein RN001_003670 [Aquatica leii]|uniref:MADF domain-containing protein n=1 Tax=Aquatica leii TaxID=1421715 RepID=A0AAN7SMF7_9COLE|nr:hypothetical protein RN001_003670 [Aquatica leii]
MSDGELIDQVRLFPLLYDKSNIFYKDHLAITNAWDTIAMILNSTAQECQRRWAILRARYNAERKKYTPAGSGGDTPTCTYFEAMSFLSDFVVQRRSKGNMAPTQKATSS